VNHDKGLRAEIDHLNTRLDALQSELIARAGYDGINLATQTLGARSINGQHNYNYLGQRLSDYEIALSNIKQLGYYIGLIEAEKLAGRSGREFGQSRDSLPSKLCTQQDCESDWYLYWLDRLQVPFTYHRKWWEFAYVAQQLLAHGMLCEGRHGLGFGCGEEPLPSLFASFGASILATDLSAEETEAGGQEWQATGQFADGLVERFRKEKWCPEPEKLARIGYEDVNMNAIPRHLAGRFDFCWSACALEHIGSIELGLQFIENSMATLRPGGVAVHTTEFNLEDGETIDNCMTVLFQKEHMLALQDRLETKGFLVKPFDFDAGGRVLDGLFDIPPWPWDVAKLNWRMLDCMTHLKRSIGGFRCTSVAITVVKPD